MKGNPYHDSRGRFTSGMKTYQEWRESEDAEELARIWGHRENVDGALKMMAVGRQGVTTKTIDKAKNYIHSVHSKLDTEYAKASLAQIKEVERKKGCEEIETRAFGDDPTANVFCLERYDWKIADTRKRRLVANMSKEELFEYAKFEEDNQPSPLTRAAGDRIRSEGLKKEFYNWRLAKTKEKKYGRS